MNKIKPTKRLRIFSGPNGSGKSTLSESVKNNKNPRIKLGIFVNADDIEREIGTTGKLDFSNYSIEVSNSELHDFIVQNGMSPKKLAEIDLTKEFVVRKNVIDYKGKINSYIAADIAAFVRTKLLISGISFSFETVFSHESKLEIMRVARELGYRIYLYFITTKDPEININRVKIRVAKNGHPVPENRIIDRYYKSLELLYPAVKISNRAFVFDNSGRYYELIAEIIEGKTVNITDNETPDWFIKYVYNQSRSKQKSATGK